MKNDIELSYKNALFSPSNMKIVFTSDDYNATKNFSLKQLRKFIKDRDIVEIPTKIKKREILDFMKYQIINEFKFFEKSSIQIRNSKLIFSSTFKLNSSIYGVFIKIIQKNLLYKFVREYLYEDSHDQYIRDIILFFIYEYDYLAICSPKHNDESYQCNYCRNYSTEHNIDFYNITSCKFINFFNGKGLDEKKLKSLETSYPIHKKCFSDFILLVNYSIIDLALPIFNEEFHKLFLFSLSEKIPIKDLQYFIFCIYYKI